jgi:predicted peptidase
VTTSQRAISAAMVVVSVGSFFAFFFIAEQVMSQSYWLADWNNRSPARAQMLAEPFEARTFVSTNGDTLLYRLQKPMEYDSTKKYPLVVCLHHGGAHGNDNIRQIEGSDAAQVLTSYENKREHPAFIFAPQCPKGAGWGGIPELPSIESLVFEAMASLEKEFAIDPKKRYVIGVSGGGYGSWHFITKRPDLFAAAIPICGGADATLAPNIVRIPVWAFHGAKDHLVPVRFSREMIDAIKNAGGDPKYTEFPEARHNIWPLVNETPGWVDWLFSQEKN